MAKVVKINKESWAVHWTPESSKNNSDHTFKTEFNIGDCTTTFFLRIFYEHETLSLCLGLQSGITDNVHDKPVRVVILVDGKMEKMEQNKCNTWNTLIKYKKFEDFLCKCPSKHNPEVQLVFILDFPVVGERCMVQHMYKLLNTGDMSDVAFIVKGKKINAHKNILVAASSVMVALFHGEKFKEGQSNTVEIEDIDHEVFEQLLHYIYTGTAPLLHEESMTEPLFSAANKYEVEGLKEICVDCLITKLKLGNAVHFLIVGNLHSATKLEKASLEVLTKYRDVVWDRPEWKTFMKSNQELFFQTCAHMFSKSKS